MLGVRYGLKCVVDDDREAFLRSPALLLQAIHIEHPVGQYLVSTCQSFHRRHGNGVKSLLFLIGSLMKMAVAQREKGIPVSDLLTAMEEGVRRCQKVMEEVRQPLSDLVQSRYQHEDKKMCETEGNTGHMFVMYGGNTSTTQWPGGLTEGKETTERRTDTAQVKQGSASAESAQSIPHRYSESSDPSTVAMIHLQLTEVQTHGEEDIDWFFEDDVPQTKCQGQYKHLQGQGHSGHGCHGNSSSDFLNAMVEEENILSDLSNCKTDFDDCFDDIPDIVNCSRVSHVKVKDTCEGHIQSVVPGSNITNLGLTFDPQRQGHKHSQGHVTQGRAVLPEVEDEFDACFDGYLGVSKVTPVMESQQSARGQWSQGQLDKGQVIRGQSHKGQDIGGQLEVDKPGTYCDLTTDVKDFFLSKSPVNSNLTKTQQILDRKLQTILEQKSRAKGQDHSAVYNASRYFKTIESTVEAQNLRTGGYSDSQHHTNNNLSPGQTGQNVILQGQNNRLPGISSSSIGQCGVPQGQRGVSQGQCEVSQGQRGVSQGQCEVSQGQRGVSQGQRGVSQGQCEVSPGQRGVSQGQRGVSKGQHGVSQGQCEVSQGQRGVSQGQRGVSQGQRAVSQGQHGVSQGQRGVSQGQRGVSQGQRGVSQGQRGVSQGQRGLSQGQRGVSQGQHGVSQGQKTDRQLTDSQQQSLDCNTTPNMKSTVKQIPNSSHLDTIQKKSNEEGFKTKLDILVGQAKSQKVARAMLQSRHFRQIGHGIETRVNGVQTDTGQSSEVKGQDTRSQSSGRQEVKGQHTGSQVSGKLQVKGQPSRPVIKGQDTEIPSSRRPEVKGQDTGSQLSVILEVKGQSGRFEVKGQDTVNGILKLGQSEVNSHSRENILEFERKKTDVKVQCIQKEVCDVDSDQILQSDEEMWEGLRGVARGLSHGNEEMMDILLDAAKRQRKIEQIKEDEHWPRLTLDLLYCCVTQGHLSAPHLVSGVVMATKITTSPLVHQYRGRQLRTMMVNGDITQTYHHIGYKRPMDVQKTMTAHDMCQAGQRSGWLDDAGHILTKLSITCLLARGSICTEVKDMCESKRIVAMENVPYKALQVMCTATKTGMCTYLLDCDNANVCTSVTLDTYEDSWMMGCNDTFVKITCLHSPVQTCVISHPNVGAGDVTEQDFWRCANILSSLLHSRYVLPGGGETEQLCSEALLHSKVLHQDLCEATSPDMYLACVLDAMATVLHEYSVNVGINTGQGHVGTPLKKGQQGHTEHQVNTGQGHSEVSQTVCKGHILPLIVDDFPVIETSGQGRQPTKKVWTPVEQTALTVIFDDYKSKMAAIQTACDFVGVALMCDSYIVTGDNPSKAPDVGWTQTKCIPGKWSNVIL